MTSSAWIVVAVDSFKGSITAAEASASIAEGWLGVAASAEFVQKPMADGGEGTLDAFAAAVPGAQRMPVRVIGPAGAPIDAVWLRLPDSTGSPGGTGVVELASTSGIELLRGALRPHDADTTGFGQAIAAAIDAGVSALVLGIGSSASTDGGLGMLRALGGTFADRAGEPVAPGARGLRELDRVDLAALRPLPPGGARVLTDVTNPLLGPSGAAAVFGPQKGLRAAELPEVDAALARFAALLGARPEEPGTGAAGGTGLALRRWGAELASGAAAVAELIGLEAAIAGAAVVITGEGSFDAQSASGKASGHVAGMAARAGVPVALVAGRIDPAADLSRFSDRISLSDLAGDEAASLADPARWLRAAGARLARRLATG